MDIEGYEEGSNKKKEENQSMADIEGVVCNDPDCCCNNHDGDMDGSSDAYGYLNGRIVLVKVGNADCPATPDDIDAMEALFKKALKDIDCRLIVTHHAVKIEII